MTPYVKDMTKGRRKIETRDFLSQPRTKWKYI